MLPTEGAVLGIDVGCSPTRESSAVCRLDWDADTVRWTIERFRAVEPERGDTIARLADRPLLAAAIDGPLRRGLDEIGAYRLAERLLTLGFQPRIGKPGQSNSPVGRPQMRTPTPARRHWRRPAASRRPAMPRRFTRRRSSKRFRPPGSAC